MNETALTILVDDREIGGVSAETAGGGHGQRFVQLDKFAARGNERLGKQSLNLHLVKVGVPDVAQGISETQLERFKDEVLNDRRVTLRKRGNIEPGENSQGEKNDQSLTVWRHFHHPMTAIID